MFVVFINNYNQIRMDRQRTRLEESQLHQIVLETLGEILYNSEPNGSKSQRALGALYARERLKADGEDSDSFDEYLEGRPKEIRDHAEWKRGGDELTDDGQDTNPLKRYYEDGELEYYRAHPEDVANYNKRKTDADMKTWGIPNGGDIYL